MTGTAGSAQRLQLLVELEHKLAAGHQLEEKLAAAAQSKSCEEPLSKGAFLVPPARGEQTA